MALRKARYEFAVFIRNMRSAQRRYFKSRDAGALSTAKELERRVDATVEEIYLGRMLYDNDTNGAA
jgi:hypothetical protein